MRVRSFGLLVLVLSVVGCDRASRGAHEQASGTVSAPAAEAPPPAPRPAMPASVSGQGARPVSVVLGANARRIQTAALSLEVADLDLVLGRVEEEAESLGGYVQDSRRGGETSSPRASFSLRVPAERFEDAVEGVSGLGKVLDATTQTEDVSQAYADLEMRLRVKKGVEARLRDILDRRTGKLSEVLEVENELARVVEEVEGIESALAGYDRRVAWSTVKVDLREAPPIVQAGLRGQVADAFRSGIGAFVAVAAGITYVVTFLFPWLVLSAVAWGGFRWVRRRAVP
jgi:hypothetical protein